MESARVDQAVAALYDTLLEESAWEAAMSAIAALFSASAISVFEFDPRRNLPVHFRYLGHDEATRLRYAGYYHALDPGRDIGLAAPVGRWLADETMLDSAAKSNQEYVCDFARPSGIGWVAGWKVYANLDSVMYFGLQRPPDADRFGVDGHAKFEALKPHLLRFGRLRERIDGASRDASFAKVGLDALGCGVVVLDDTLRVQLANSCAQAVLRQGCALVERLGSLRGRSRLDHENLMRAVKSACSVPGRSDAFLAHLYGDDLPALPVVAVPLSVSHVLANATPGRVCLLLFDGSAPGRGSPVLYRSLFGLTHAESELMAALASGKSLGEYADGRGISLATARTQLRTVFAKTGVDSQARLVGLAHRLPPFGEPS